MLVNLFNVVSPVLQRVSFGITARHVSWSYDYPGIRCELVVTEGLLLGQSSASDLAEAKKALQCVAEPRAAR